MIIFIPAYDSSTKANLTVFSSISQNYQNHHIFLEKYATLLDFDTHLGEGNDYFVMTHGYSNQFNDNNDVSVANTNDAQKFRQNTLFIFACYTANELAKKVSDNDNMYWGYTGPINSFIEDGRSLGIFGEILSFILDNFIGAKKEDEVLLFLNALKEKCDEATWLIDEISDTHRDYDCFEAYSCLNRIWQRLRVYLPYSEEYIKHPDAATGDIFEK